MLTILPDMGEFGIKIFFVCPIGILLIAELISLLAVRRRSKQKGEKAKRWHLCWRSDYGAGNILIVWESQVELLSHLNQTLWQCSYAPKSVDIEIESMFNLPRVLRLIPNGQQRESLTVSLFNSSRLRRALSKSCGSG